MGEQGAKKKTKNTMPPLDIAEGGKQDILGFFGMTSLRVAVATYPSSRERRQPLGLGSAPRDTVRSGSQSLLAWQRRLEPLRVALRRSQIIAR